MTSVYKSVPYLIRFLDYSGIEKWTHKTWPMQGSSFADGALIDTVKANFVRGSVLLDVWRLFPQPHHVYCDVSVYAEDDAVETEESLMKSCEAISEMVQQSAEARVTLTLPIVGDALRHVSDSIFRPNPPFHGQVTVDVVDGERVVKVGGCALTIDDLRALATILIKA